MISILTERRLHSSQSSAESEATTATTSTSTTATANTRTSQPFPLLMLPLVPAAACGVLLLLIDQQKVNAVPAEWISSSFVDDVDWKLLHFVAMLCACCNQFWSVGVNTEKVS